MLRSSLTEGREGGKRKNKNKKASLVVARDTVTKYSHERSSFFQYCILTLVSLDRYNSELPNAVIVELAARTYDSKGWWNKRPYTLMHARKVEIDSLHLCIK